jgi:hypothetical protein
LADALTGFVRMAHAENRELSALLEEAQTGGFIREF